MIFEWLMLAKNLGSGPGRPTAYYVVHGILVCVNIVLAVILGVISWRAWASPRRGQHQEPERRADERVERPVRDEPSA
ncbi:hypothetical protein OG417_06340 [Actinoallomurus sp. NBC_01490]|nr:hypothetical protein [Actinoallomurus sp. NBC_01490]